MELVFTEQDEQTLVRLSGEGSEIYKQLVFDLSAATLASRVSKKSSVLVRWNSSCDLETYLSCLKDFYTDFVQVILLQYVEQASSYQNSWLNTLLYYTNARTFKPEVTYQKLACIERFLHATMAPETNDLTVCDLFFSFAKFKQELAKLDDFI